MREAEIWEKILKAKNLARKYPKKVRDYTQPGELVGLKWEDVDFKSKTIQIRRSMEYRYSAKEWRIGEPKSK